MSYDPTGAEILEDADIGSDSYIVTAYNDSGASSVGPDFSNSDGSYRGTSQRKGPRPGTMTIECEDANQAAPAQFETFTYKGVGWVILQVAEAQGSTAPASWSLTLRCTDIPGTLKTLTLTAPGSSYETDPTVSFSGGGGTGAAATATTDGSAITTITITNPGRGYTTAPTVTLTGGGGTGATATATITAP